MKRDCLWFLVVGVVVFLGDWRVGESEPQNESACTSSNPTFFSADANGDRQLDIADPVYLLNFLFLGGEPPVCLAEPPTICEVCDDMFVNEGQENSITPEMLTFDPATRGEIELLTSRVQALEQVVQVGVCEVPGSVACYGFDEGDAAVAEDCSGSGRNGAIQGAVHLAVIGRRALQFQPFPDNGRNCDDHVMVSDGAFDPDLATEAFTWEAWIRLDSIRTNNSATIVSHAGTGWTGVQIFGVLPDGRLRFDLGTGSTFAIVEGQTVLQTGHWYHVAATYNGATGKVYLDGVEDGSLTTSYTPPSEGTWRRLTIGTDSRIPCDLPEESTGFHGAIDEVRIYNRSLSAREIRVRAPCTAP